MSLDMTKVIDKLKPIEKRRNEAEAYFRIRENYQKKAIQFDFSIKSKLCYNKLNFEEKMISKTSCSKPLTLTGGNAKLCQCG